MCRWQGDYNGQEQKWFPVNFTEETTIKPKVEEVFFVTFFFFLVIIYSVLQLLIKHLIFV